MADPDDPGATWAEGPAPTASPSRPGADGSLPVEDSDRYMLGGVLGRGGTGEVRVARDRVLDRDVAFKVLLSGRAEARAWFVREARVTGRLEHPNIAPVHDLGVDAAGRPFFTLRRIAGTTLAERIAAGDLGSRRERLDVFRKTADAVAFAHAAGVVHSDLKPENVMVGTFGEVIVLDWGVAVAPGEEDRERAIVGTPAWMAPEQARGERATVDARTDVYGLGALLYLLLCDAPPFGDGDPPAVLARVAEGSFLPPRAVARIPADLEAVVLRAMAREPGARYPSVAALRADVDAWQEDAPVSAVPETVARRVRRWARRNARTALLAGAAMAMATAVGVAALLWHVEEITVARDRALRAEQDADERHADSEIALALVDAELGRHAPAIHHLARAREALERHGLPTERAWATEAWILGRYVPPAAAWVFPEGHANVTLSPSGSRVALTRPGRFDVARLSDGAVVDGGLVAGTGFPVTAWFDEDLVMAVHTGGAWELSVGGRPLGTTPDRPIGIRQVGRSLWLSTAALGTLAIDPATAERTVVHPDCGVMFGASADGARLLGYRIIGAPERQPDVFTLWEIPSGRVLAQWTATSRAVLSPSGRYVALYGDGEVEVRDVLDPSARHGVPTGGAGSLAAFADGDVFVVGTMTGQVSWWDAATWTPLARVDIPGHVAEVSADGAWVAGTGPDRVEVWRRPAPAAPVDTDSPTEVAPSPDRTLLAAVGWRGDLAITDVETGWELWRAQVERSGVRDVAWSEDGAALWTADRAGRVIAWDPRVDGPRSVREPFPGRIAVAVVPVGDVLAGVFESGTVVVWDRSPGGAERSRFETGLSPWEARAVGDPPVLLVSGRGDDDPAWMTFDLATGARIARSAFSGAAYEIATTEDRWTALVGTQLGRAVRVDLRTGEERELRTQRETVAVALSADGRLAATGDVSGELQLLGPDDEALLVVSAGGGAPVSEATFVGERLVVYGPHGHVATWDPHRPERQAAAVVEIGGPTDALHARLARGAAMRGDWAAAASEAAAARADGQALDAMTEVRWLAAAGRKDEARARLADVVPGPELSAGTLALWAAALN